MIAAILLLILLSFVVFVIYFDRPSFVFYLSLTILALSFAYLTIATFRDSQPALPEVVVLTFLFAFIWIAPLVQLMQTGHSLVNTALFNTDVAAIANSISALFIVAYSSVIILERPLRLDQDVAAFDGNLELRSAGTLIVVSTLIVILAFVSLAAASAGEASSGPFYIFVKKFVWLLPTAIFFAALAEWRDQVSSKGSGIVTFGVLGTLLFLAVLTENPLVEKRNALGPVYLTLIYLLFRGFFTSKVRELLLVSLAIFLAFPLTALITHARHGVVSGKSILDVIVEHFFTVHYDAWANICAVVEIVHSRGIMYGEQLAGSVLFFIPSQLWTLKPKATGIVLGDYLSDRYAMWFNNLSAPIIGEAYLDFHLLGVVAYAVVLGKAVLFLKRRILFGVTPIDRILAIYMSFFLALVLRGSLMIAVAYGVASVLAFKSLRVLAYRRSHPEHESKS